MKTILLVEDDEFIGRAYKDGLERAGYTVLRATDGEEVSDVLKKNHPPDLIVLDIVMPLKNGFEVLSDLKASTLYQHIPVIMLSNLGQESDIEKAKKAGALDYLVKNRLSLKEVVSRIEEHMRSLGLAAEEHL